MKRLLACLCVCVLGACGPSPKSSGVCVGQNSPTPLAYLGSAEDNKDLLGSIVRHDDHMLTPSRAASIVVERRNPSTRASIKYGGGQRQLHFQGSKALINVMVVSASSFSVEATTKAKCCFQQSFVVDREGVWLLKMTC